MLEIDIFKICLVSKIVVYLLKIIEMFQFNLLFINFVVFFFCATLNAQKSNFGNWLIYFGNQKISKNLNLWNEVQYRSYNGFGDTEQLLLRAGLGYNLTENNNNILVGYAFINSKSYIAGTEDKLSRNENRLYQQFITKSVFGRFNIQHRYRLEERFIESDFRMRFRYFLSLNVPINKKTMESGAIYLSAYNEIFLNNQKTVFDRNRIYGGIGYVFNKNFRMEAAVMSQIFENRTRPQFQIVLFNNIPFIN